MCVTLAKSQLRASGRQEVTSGTFDLAVCPECRTVSRYIYSAGEGYGVCDIHKRLWWTDAHIALRWDARARQTQKKNRIPLVKYSSIQPEHLISKFTFRWPAAGGCRRCGKWTKATPDPRMFLQGSKVRVCQQCGAQCDRRLVSLLRRWHDPKIKPDLKEYVYMQLSNDKGVCELSAGQLSELLHVARHFGWDGRTSIEDNCMSPEDAHSWAASLEVALPWIASDALDALHPEWMPPHRSDRWSPSAHQIFKTCIGDALAGRESGFVREVIEIARAGAVKIQPWIMKVGCDAVRGLGMLEGIVLRCDAALLQVVAQEVVELMDIVDCHPTVAAESLCKSVPPIRRYYGEQRVEVLAAFLMHAEVLPASVEFQRRYDDFNRRFFAARLPAYKIRVVFDLHTAAAEPLSGSTASSGLIRVAARQIYLRFTGAESMVATLLHEMCHAAAGVNHGKRWVAEMKRVKDAGAPVADWELE